MFSKQIKNWEHIFLNSFYGTKLFLRQFLRQYASIFAPILSGL